LISILAKGDHQSQCCFFSAASVSLMTNTIHVFSGPVMLLELCDMTLKDWLSDNSTVTADILEDMSIFVLHIARAVEFLHSQQVACHLWV